MKNRLLRVTITEKADFLNGAYLAEAFIRLPLLQINYFPWMKYYFCSKRVFCISLFNATGLLLQPLIASENLRFSSVLRGYRKRVMAWNRLTYLYSSSKSCPFQGFCQFPEMFFSKYLPLATLKFSVQKIISMHCNF